MTTNSILFELLFLLCLSQAITLYLLLQKSKHRKKQPQASLNEPEYLREAQAYIQCMIDSMPQTLIAVNPSNRITHWNLAAEKATGIKPQDAIGTLIHEAYPTLPLSTATLKETIQNKTPYTRENIQQGLGSNATFMNLTLYPLESEDDAMQGAVIMAEDVTMRVRIESMMIQNEKIMSLGELAAGVAHEINNPLAGILNTAQNIQRRLSPGLPSNERMADELGVSLQDLSRYLTHREIYSFLAQIREGCERAAHIVTNLLEFSRGNNRNFVPTDLAHLIEHSLELASNTFKLTTHLGIELPEVKKEFAAHMPPVPCVAAEIQQVILNLLKNAAQAFQSDEYGPPLKPEIIIRTGVEDDFAILEICDNGPGIAENIRSHIFEPFFTTKDVGQGTGLGLSVSYFIVSEHHSGTIEVDSRPGYGTTFIIRLPLKQIQSM